MTSADRRGPRVPAAVVLYEPDLGELDVLLRAMEAGNRTLYVFENGPVAAEAAQRVGQATGAIVVRSSRNVGLGAALNALAERAVADGWSHLLLLDQDSEPPPDLPERLLERMRRADADGSGRPVAAMGPRLVPPDDGLFRPLRYDWRDRAGRELWFLPTSGTLLDLAAWGRIGPFRADYFIGGLDVEWGLRAAAHGHRSLLADDLAMPHRWGLPAGDAAAGRATPQILRQSPLRTYYYVRNACHCLALGHAPVGWRLRSGARLLAQLTWLWTSRRAPSGAGRAACRGVWDAIRGRLGPAPHALGSPRPSGA